MKSKKMVKLTLVTLLAPTFLNAQIAMADSVVGEEATQPVVVEKTNATTDSSVETPKAEAPVVEVPKVEVPTVEAPASEEPKVDTPVAEEPKVDTPAVTTPAPTMPEAPSADPAPTPTPGDDVGHVPPTVNVDNAPSFSVVSVKTIKKGSTFDPLAGVYAFDNVDGDISSKIVVESNNVNTAVANDGAKDTPYNVTYSVTNSAGKKSTVTVSVIVVDASVYGMLDASIADFTLPQNADYNAEIKKRIVVKNPDGSIADPSEYVIATSGSAGGGETGTFQISVVVQSLKYNTLAETTVNITVISGLTLTASDQTLFVGDTFDKMKGVTATETKADGSTVALGAYNGTTDSGISVYGDVDTSTPGTYPVTYSAKSSSGVVDTKTVNVTVIASVVTIEANDVEIMQGEAFNPLDYAKATDQKDGALAVKVDFSDVNPDVTGSYSVTYSATNSAGTTEIKTITVTVVERKATIVAENQVVYEGQEVTSDMILGWATATDPVDKDLTVLYAVVAGDGVSNTIDTSVAGSTHTVEYSVTNSAGNETKKTITVTVVEREVSIDAVDQTVEVGTKVTNDMILGWAKASDSVDGDNIALKDFKVLDGPIDTTKPGTFTIEYSYTNSLNKTVTKTITLTVVDSLEPSIKAEDKVMYVGDKLTKEMILEWAVAENAEKVGFEVVGDGIKIKAADSTLVEAGVHEIKFFALRGDKVAETTMTLTVKDVDLTPVDDSNEAITSNTNSKPAKTKVITKASKELPKTGVKENGMMSSIAGMMMVVGAYFLKKKKDEENSMDLF